MLPEFRNEPLADFAQPANRDAMQGALAVVRADFGRDWPLVIGGERVTTGEWIESFDPCQPDRRVGRVAKATRGFAEHALKSAWNAFPEWARWPPAERARVLFKAAALLRRQKH